jgi:hypothetical protein
MADAKVSDAKVQELRAAMEPIDEGGEAGEVDGPSKLPPATPAQQAFDLLATTALTDGKEILQTQQAGRRKTSLMRKSTDRVAEAPAPEELAGGAAAEGTGAAAEAAGSAATEAATALAVNVPGTSRKQSMRLLAQEPSTPQVRATQPQTPAAQSAKTAQQTPAAAPARSFIDPLAENISEELPKLINELVRAAMDDNVAMLRLLISQVPTVPT